mmetsp:Transcript_6813/g.17078  ORF Transcript_6813/g.17078 Transcript_6813/m.17078 type:complete len:540 (-) Transcript_6813:45-1664(-)|eukprot:CAMPEP_0172397482 /NCGR_PEP_ID=MMETSP1061-20121228/30821_1 /TAXON_ID=37318 /ORGANISM="Pseudo-nitzschia pungens, Strain cf. pungens" /LENGTH=539 /DNA_ID=CAMNT_0013129675 /DNA_START=214 /DNA_END=1833 /DNA_ORIENTATION=-
MSDTLSTLKDWSRSGKLSEVAFGENENGAAALKLGDVSLPAAESLDVVVASNNNSNNNNKTCKYTVGSIFLQLVDVNQSLLAYRKACKKHQVKDAIKASDKAEIIAFFKGGAAASVAASVSATAVAAPSEAEPRSAGGAAASSSASEAAPSSSRERGRDRDRDRDRDRHHDRDRDRHHDDRKKDRHHHHHHHRSSKKRERERERERDPSRSSSSSRQQPSTERKEKVHKPIDPEMLFSNLSVVVGKREIKAKRDAEQAKLHQALSTNGFGSLAPELIAKFNNLDSMAHEIPVGDSASILKAGAGKDLSRILKLYSETMSKKSSGSGKHSSSLTSASASSSGGSKGRSSYDDGQQKRSWRPYLVGKKPIIVLPKGMTAPITLVNAHKFFAESKFVGRDKIQKELRTKRQAPKTQFSRQVNARFGGGAVEYELMDNPKSKLHRPEDWERVVAVVALGQSWQMKDWPGSYSNPVQLFNRVLGFYVGMEGDNIPKEIQGWAVTQTKVNRDKRGLDSVTYASFWNALDEWMAIHKPELLPQSSN